MLSFSAVAFVSCVDSEVASESKCVFCDSIVYKSDQYFKCLHSGGMYEIENNNDTVILSRHDLAGDENYSRPREWISYFNKSIIKKHSFFLEISRKPFDAIIIKPNDFNREILSIEIKKTSRLADSLVIKKSNFDSLVIFSNEIIDSTAKLYIVVKSKGGFDLSKPNETYDYISYSVFPFLNKRDLLENNLYLNRNKLLLDYKLH